jgi:hypothetical protein
MATEKTFADGVQSATGKTVVNRTHQTLHHQERRPMSHTGRRMGRNFDYRDNAQNQRNLQPRKSHGRQSHWAHDGHGSICRKHGGHLWLNCYDNPQGQSY